MKTETVYRIYEKIEGRPKALRYESKEPEHIRSVFETLNRHEPDKFEFKKEFQVVMPEEINILNPELLTATKAKAEKVQAEVGKKYDSNKPMAGAIVRVFPKAVMAIGAVIKFGAKKYPNPNNWKMNEDIINRYFDSAIRHACKHFDGYEKDEETGLPHLVHAAWNMLAILEKYLMENPEVAKTIMFPDEVRDK